MNNRTLYSPHGKFSATIRVGTEEKRCVFLTEEKHRVYQPLNADQSELGVDEFPLLLRHDGHGVDFFIRTEWAERAKESLKANYTGVIDDIVGEKDDQIKTQESEIALLKEQLKKSKPAPVKVESTNDSIEAVKASATGKRKAGRPKKK